MQIILILITPLTVPVYLPTKAMYTACLASRNCVTETCIDIDGLKRVTDAVETAILADESVAGPRFGW